MPDLKGRFSVSSARELVRMKFPAMDGANLIWRSAVHPSLAAQNWKLMRGACATLDKVRSRFKIQLPNRCVCKKMEESLEHILWSCEFAVRIWDWIASIFALKPDANPVVSYKAASGRSCMVKELWLVANLVIRAELWFNRNKITFQKQVMGWNLFMQRVCKMISDYSCRLKGDMHNTVEDVRVLEFFRVRHRKVKHTEPVACFWSPPEYDELLLCCDGASQGNPGSAGAGVIARDANCGVLGAMSIGLGFASNYVAELYAILLGLEWALQWGYTKILVRTDSSSVVRALEDFSLPWFAQQRWLAVWNMFETIRFVHTYREANFSADNLAKQGSLLAKGVRIAYVGRPSFLRTIELPNVSYFRFK